MYSSFKCCDFVQLLSVCQSERRWYHITSEHDRPSWLTMKKIEKVVGRKRSVAQVLSNGKWLLFLLVPNQISNTRRKWTIFF